MNARTAETMRQARRLVMLRLLSGPATLDEWGEPCQWAEAELCSACAGKEVSP